MKLLARMGRVEEVAHDHFFLRTTVAEMAGIAAAIAAGKPSGEFTAADLRDRLDNGRKVAIQILEFFDRHGVTLRRGDLRRIVQDRVGLFGEPAPAPTEGNRSRWSGRTSNPDGAVSRSLVGSNSHSLPPFRPLTPVTRPPAFLSTLEAAAHAADAEETAFRREAAARIESSGAGADIRVPPAECAARHGRGGAPGTRCRRFDRGPAGL